MNSLLWQVPFLMFTPGIAQRSIPVFVLAYASGSVVVQYNEGEKNM
jgi:hypothetical protein